MNYINYKLYDVANGPGVRVTIFVAGCPHNPKCPNCFNPETWSFESGKPFTEEIIELLIEEAKKDHIAGITLLGGEPMALKNQEGLLPYVKRFKEECPEKTVWSYTGYDYEKDILKMYKDNEITQQLIPMIDILVDGKFVEDLKNPRLAFKGSENQKIIDIKKSLESKEIIIWDKPIYC